MIEQLQRTTITWPGIFSPVGWSIPEDLSFKEWLEAGEKLLSKFVHVLKSEGCK